MLNSWDTALLLTVAVSACHPDEALNPQQIALRTQEATARCKAGEASACATACKLGGLNITCRRACENNEGEACLQLATRLERGIDSGEPGTSPSKIPEDDDGATDAYEHACSLGLAQGCRMAASRILNGQTLRRRDPSLVTNLLRRACDRMEDPDSCCMMAQLNFRLAHSRAMDIGVNFRMEGRKWAKLAEAYGGVCPIPPGMDR